MTYTNTDKLKSLTSEALEFANDIQHFPTSMEKRELQYSLGSTLQDIRKELPSDNEFGSFCSDIMSDHNQKALHRYRQLPAFGTCDECELVGFTNVYKLSQDGNEEFKKQVKEMIASGKERKEVRTAVKEHFEVTPTEVVYDERDEMISLLSNQLRGVYLEMLGDELPQAIQDSINELEEKERSEEQEIPADIIAELLNEEDDEEMLEFHEEIEEEEIVEEDNEPEVTKAQYEKARELVKLGIGSEVDKAIVKVYEEEHNIVRNAGSARDRLARLARNYPTPSTTRKVFVGTPVEDDSEYDEWSE